MQNAKFEFQIPFSFPLFEVKTAIEYANTEKPSGISYLILTLINEFSGKEMTMSELMSIIGVPDDLFSIFMKELLELIDNGVIQTNGIDSDDMSLEEFPNLHIGDFSMTAIGKEIFQSEILPSKERLNIRQTMYYDPINQSVTVHSPATYLTDSPNISVAMDDHRRLEDWIHENKFMLGIKKDQRILSIAVLDKLQKGISRPAKIELDIETSRCDISFPQQEVTQFFEKYIRHEQLETVILNGRSEYSEIDRDVAKTANRVLQTNVIDETIKKSYRLFFSSKLTTKTAKTVIPIKFKDFLFVAVDRQALGYQRASLPGAYSDKKWKLLLPCILETAVNFSELEPIAVEHVKTLPLADSVDDVINVVDVFQTSNVVQKLILDRIAPDKEGVRMLELLSNKGRQIAILSETIRKTTSHWLLDWCDSLTKNWNEDTVKLVLRVRSLSDWKEDQVIDALVERVPNEMPSKFTLLDWMTTNGIRETAVLGKMNLIPEMVSVVSSISTKKGDKARDIVGTYPLAMKFRAWKEAFQNINALLGLEDPDHYTSTKEYSITDFKKAYDTYRKARKDVDTYQVFDKLGYDSFAKHVAVYEAIAEMIAKQEKINLTSPDKLTKSYITDYISDRQDMMALISLARKGESIFKKNNASINLEEAINTASEMKLISPKELQDLHRFRKERNNAVHYNTSNRAPDYDKNDLLRWLDLWFRIEADYKSKMMEEKRK